MCICSDTKFIYAARLKRPGENIEFDWHMASGFGRSIREISSISHRRPRTQGTFHCLFHRYLPCETMEFSAFYLTTFSPWTSICFILYSQCKLISTLICLVSQANSFSLNNEQYAFALFLQTAGVDFPPREENTVPLFTPPQSQPLRQPHLYPPGQSYEDVAIQASLQSSAPAASALRYSLSRMHI
jgi:hypothetical protein